MGKFVDLTGQVFNYLYVDSYAGKGKYNCICLGIGFGINLDPDFYCGNHVLVYGSNLKSSGVKSCGKYLTCKAAHILRSNAAIVSNITHGLTGTIEYLHLRGMINRCTNSEHVSYSNYGGRMLNGILDPVTIYQNWIDNPQNFKDYLNNDSRMPETLTPTTTTILNKELEDSIKDDGKETSILYDLYKSFLKDNWKSYIIFQNY